jgi:hypothetical protein
MNKRSTEEEWLKQLRCKVQNHEEKLPINGWQKLSQSLSLSSQHVFWKRVSRIVAAAVIAALLLWPFAGDHLFKKSIETSRQNDLAKTPCLEKTLSTSLNLTSSRVTAVVEKKIRYRSIRVKRAVANEIVAAHDTTCVEKVQNNEESFSTSVTNKKQITENRNKSVQKLVIPDFSLSDKELMKSYNVELIFAMGGNGICSNISENGSNLVRTESETNLSDDGFSRNQAETPFIGQTQVEMRHRLPLKMGLLVSKRITKALSIETGLTGTYLLSVPRDESLGNNYDQRIYYIGVPLKVSYHFYHQKRVSAYWSNGVESEKCVSAKRGDTKLHLNKLQWSVNSALGMQVSISSHIGLFAEPGVSYYWGNGTKIETFRTEHPLSIELHFGLKLNL